MQNAKEYTGPKGNCRVLATEWANGLDFSELPGHLRHRAVRLAAEACLVQLLITGFIHADPHEGGSVHGNLKGPPPPRNKALIRLSQGKPMVNSPLIRPCFLGGVALGGSP